jgi:hypothetical protein
MNDEMKCKVVPVCEHHAIKAPNRKVDINTRLFAWTLDGGGRQEQTSVPPGQKSDWCRPWFRCEWQANFSSSADLPKPMAHPRCRYRANPACEKYIIIVIVTIMLPTTVTTV